MSSEKLGEIKPIVTNLIRQNCFVRDVSLNTSVVSSDDRYSDVTYESVDEVLRDDGTGVDLNYSENSYPITPQYVQSYVDSADYHGDPLAAIANSSARQNLGDVRDYQAVDRMDTADQIKLFEQLKAKFANASQTSVSPTSPVSSDVGE